MRRWAVIAGSGAILLAISGCAWVRPREERSAASAARSALCQQLSQAAQTAIDHRDYEQARADLERLIVEAPRSAEAFHRLGRVFQFQDRLPEAELAYYHALKLDPDYVEALIGLGEVEIRLGRQEKALERFEAAIEVDPRHAEAHLGKGRLLESMGRTDEALAAYFRTLELDPTSVPVALRIATIQIARRQPEQALARLDQILESNPDIPEARHQRGLAHLTLKHFPEAVADLQFASQKLPNHPDVFYHLALALDADHKPVEAFEAAEQALKLAPGYADARSLSERLRR